MITFRGDDDDDFAYFYRTMTILPTFRGRWRFCLLLEDDDDDNDGILDVDDPDDDNDGIPDEGKRNIFIWWPGKVYFAKKRHWKVIFSKDINSRNRVVITGDRF